MNPVKPLSDHNLFFLLAGKSQSNLNEIDKSEQKSGDLDRKGNYKWSSDNGKDLSLNIRHSKRRQIKVQFNL